MPRATRLASELVRRRKPPPQRLIMSAAGELNASELNARVMAVSHRGRYRRPHLAKLVGEPMPRQFSELSNEVLCSMAATEHVRGAVKERLRREIMVVDECEYEEACERLTKMATAVPGQSLYKLPYVCGIVSAALTSAGSILCVFHRDTAIWFCERWVGDSVPELGELDTVWKVGAWTWTWMEPAIGTASFVLLGMALIRAQMAKLRLKPYDHHIQTRYADRMASAFPMYEREIVRDFAKSSALRGMRNFTGYSIPGARPSHF